MRNDDLEAITLEIHRRLLAGDAIAPADAAERLLPHLTSRLRRKWPRLDEDILLDCAVDAILSYSENPAAFDRRRSPLLTYLFVAANGDIKNILAKTKRRHELFEDYRVEERHSARNKEMSDPELVLIGDLDEQHSDEERLALIVEEFADSKDRKVLELMLNGERKTAAFASVLDLSSLSKREQAAAVKKHKDRIKKRLERIRKPRT